MKSVEYSFTVSFQFVQRQTGNTKNFSPEHQCLPRRSRGKHRDSKETKFTVPQGTSHKVICYIAKQMRSRLIKTKANFEKLAEIPPTTSGHLQLHALITCNSGQHLATFCHSFRTVTRQVQKSDQINLDRLFE